MGSGETAPERSGSTLAFWIPLIVLGGLLYLAHQKTEDDSFEPDSGVEEPFVPPEQEELDRGSPEKVHPDSYQDDSNRSRKVVHLNVQNEKDLSNTEIEAVKESGVPKYWHVQVSSSSNEANARSYARELIDKGLNEVGVIFFENAYKVIVGRFATEQEAIDHSKYIRVKNKIDAFQKEIRPQ